jgi:hypothetical protein
MRFAAPWSAPRAHMGKPEDRAAMAGVGAAAEYDTAEAAAGAAADPPQPEPACLRPAARAVVADDGREIRLKVYTKADTAAAVVLDRRAIRIAGELIGAALPKPDAP